MESTIGSIPSITLSGATAFVSRLNVSICVLEERISIRKPVAIHILSRVSELILLVPEGISSVGIEAILREVVNS
jgi:hypothetical protein